MIRFFEGEMPRSGGFYGHGRQPETGIEGDYAVVKGAFPSEIED